MYPYTYGIDKMLRVSEVCDFTGLKKTTVYRKIGLGLFPRQVQVGDPDAKRGTARWALSDVTEWVDAHKKGLSWTDKTSQRHADASAQEAV